MLPEAGPLRVCNLGRWGLQERLARERQGHPLLPQACADTHTCTHTQTSTHNSRARVKGQPHRIREALTPVGWGEAPSGGLTGESALIV